MSRVGTLPPVVYGSRGSGHRTRPLRPPPARPPRRAPHPPARASSRGRSAASTHAPLGRRIGLFRVLLVMLLLAVVARLADIQVVHSSHYTRLAADELSVTVADPGLRGDSVSGGGTKPATLETGATLQVPLFVEVGERIRVDTRSGEYVSRA